MSKPVKKVILAYSGGLDTSVILKWIAENYQCEVVTMTADLGQDEDLSGIDAKARKTGAVKAYVEDLKDEFARDFALPMMRAGAIYEDRYLLGTSIARPCIARRMVEIAYKEGADAVAHGATGKGNDQVRFELSVASLAPEIRTIAPWREWNFKSRTDLNNYAAKHGIPLPEKANRYSMDRNMLHLSYESGELEDPWEEGRIGTYTMCAHPDTAPNEAEYITIDFVKGDPVAINGEKLSPAELIIRLNKIAGKHGVGRMDMVENRFVGMKARGIYESPAATVLHIAHRDLEGICLDREVMHIRDSLLPRYATCIYNGFWFSPERDALQALIDKSQENVTGAVRLRLFKGSALAVGRKSPSSLFRVDLATFEEDNVYDQAQAKGFIQLNSWRIQGYARLKK